MVILPHLGGFVNAFCEEGGVYEKQPYAKRTGLFWMSFLGEMSPFHGLVVE